MLRVASLTFILLGLAFAAGVMGSVMGPLGLFLALGFVVAAILAGTSDVSGGFRPLMLVLAVPALLCGVVLLAAWPDGQVNRLLAFAVLLAGFDVAFRAFGRVRRELFLSAAASLLIAIFFLVLEYSPPAWMAWQRASLGVSSLVGRVVGRPLSLAPSYSGFNVTAFVLTFVLVIFVRTGRRTFRRLLFALAYLLVIVFGYIVLMTFLPTFDDPAHLSEVGKRLGESAAKHVLPVLARHVPWNMPGVLLLLQLPVLWIIGRRVRVRWCRVLPKGASEIRWAGALALVLLLAAAALVVRRVERPPAADPANPDDAPQTRVVLYEKGYLNWSKPDFRSFGSYSPGMLGRLPIFLGQLGMDVTLSGTLDEKTLAGARIAVMFNLYEMLSREEHAALWDFVRRGGSLLVVGDHTWLNEKNEDTLNDVLSPSDIRFNFDSATYQIGGWLYGYGFAPDALFRRMRNDMNQAGIGIGASLRLRGEAEPLLFGVHGYSDDGIRSRRPQLGFMGDSRYVPGEQLGDVVLAAEQNVGAGRVVVFGDTSGFLNLLMMGSHETVSRLFGKLATAPAPRYHTARLAAALACIIAACALFAVGRRPAVVPVLVVSLTIGVGIHLLEARSAAPIQLTPAGDLAWVDSSHVGKFSREVWREDGLAGLYLNLMRNDVQTLRMDSLDRERLSGARMLFIVAPTRKYSEREADVIEDFVKGGGYVVVCAGADSADAVERLLRRFGMQVRNKPLGPFVTHFPAGGGMVRFHIGYAVESTGSGKPNILAWYVSPGTAVIMERLYPVDASTGAGRGGFMLIGDDHFLFNMNLEPEKKPPIMENVNFVRWLVRHVRELRNAGRKR